MGRDSEADRLFKATASFEKAQVELQKESFSSAITLLKEAIEISLDPYLSLEATAYLVYAEFRNAFAEDPKETQVAPFIDRLRRVDKDKSLKELPFLLIGRMYRTVGKFELAAIEYETALELNPGSQEALDALAFLRRQESESSIDSNGEGLAKAPVKGPLWKKLVFLGVLLYGIIGLNLYLHLPSEEVRRVSLEVEILNGLLPANAVEFVRDTARVSTSDEWILALEEDRLTSLCSNLKDRLTTFNIREALILGESRETWIHCDEVGGKRRLPPEGRD